VQDGLGGISAALPVCLQNRKDTQGDAEEKECLLVFPGRMKDRNANTTIWVD